MPPKNGNAPNSRFCFTLNNPTADERDQLANWWSGNTLRYLVYQDEVGVEAGVPHIQGYVVFESRNRTNFNTIKTRLPRAHIEVARGSHRQNQAYCTKLETRAGDVREYGTCPRDGEASNCIQEQLKAAVESSKQANCNIQTFREQHCVIEAKYPRYYERLERGLQKREAIELSEQGYPEVYWFFGVAGVGKTTTVKKIAKQLEDEYFLLDEVSGVCWWDGYEGEKCIIIDDVDPRWMKIDFLKSVTDRARETRGAIKGKVVYITARHVIITSVQHPHDLYASDELDRRIRHVFRLPEYFMGRIKIVLYSNVEMDNTCGACVLCATPAPPHGGAARS